MKDRIIEDYRPFLSNLSEISYDSEHGVSLIQDKKPNHRMYNFDGISDKFSKKTRGEKNMSCDGYYEKASGDTYLIEFKNQEEGQIDKRWLKNKIYDSISTIVMNENIARKDVAGRTTVIVVYNDKNKEPLNDQSYSTSPAFNKFSQKMAYLAEKRGIDSYDKKFDLVRYKGLLFKDVYTVDKEIFEKDFMDVIF